MAENHLLELLPRADRVRIESLCEPVHFALSEILHEPGATTRHVYFPVEGFVSLVAAVPDHPGLEVGMVGREGMLGAHIALGAAASPQRAVVQGSGSALRMSAKSFRTELARSASLQRTLDRYVYVMLSQLATSAACVRFHQIGERLARWLLMSQDRAHAETFHLTQEFVAYMLGVRRVGITTAAHGLQRDGLIAYHRGELTVLDRAGLERAACTCYASDRATYAKHL